MTIANIEVALEFWRVYPLMAGICSVLGFCKHLLFIIMLLVYSNIVGYIFIYFIK